LGLSKILGLKPNISTQQGHVSLCCFCEGQVFEEASISSRVTKSALAMNHSFDVEG
jgi:hypothetical protein